MALRKKYKNAGRYLSYRHSLTNAKAKKYYSQYRFEKFF